MTRKKRELQNGLPARSDANYMKLYRERNAVRVKQYSKTRFNEKKEQNPNFWKEAYDPKRAKDYRNKNKKVIMEKAWRKYGMTDMTYERFEEQLSKQDNKCAICTKIMKLPQTDHDHNTGKFRGLLCVACNNGLGIYELHKSKFEQYLREKLS